MNLRRCASLYVDQTLRYVPFTRISCFGFRLKFKAYYTQNLRFFSRFINKQEDHEWGRAGSQNRPGRSCNSARLSRENRSHFRVKTGHGGPFFYDFGPKLHRTTTPFGPPAQSAPYTYGSVYFKVITYFVHAIFKSVLVCTPFSSYMIKSIRTAFSITRWKKI